LIAWELCNSLLVNPVAVIVLLPAKI